MKEKPEAPERPERPEGRKIPDVVAKGRKVLGDRNHADTEKTETAHKMFNIKEVVKRGIITIHDQELGEVKFGDITLQDLFTAKEFDLSQDIEKTLALIYLMLKKADQSIELKDVLAAPGDIQWKLIEICSARSPFLQKMLKTYGKDGLLLTQQPK